MMMTVKFMSLYIKGLTPWKKKKQQLTALLTLDYGCLLTILVLMTARLR